MTRATRRGRAAGAIATLIVAMLVAGASARQANTDALFQEGRRLFEALDYENAVKALDQAIVALLANPPLDAARRERLASAYEMRARSKFGLGDIDAAKADLVALLKVNPGHTITGQVSPRFVALLDATLAETVTTLNLAVTPPTATVLLDDVAIPATGMIRITAGDHVLSIEQRGYKGVKQPVTARLGETAEVTVALDRVSAVLKVLTVPADVEITMDGTKAGKTAAGPPAPEFSDAVAKAGVPPATVSAAMVLGDIAPGTHTLEFTRDCFVKASQPVAVDKPADFTIGPVIMQPAVASLSVTANDPEARVFVDGKDRGAAPFTMNDLCEGIHLVELRSRIGRDARRVEAKPGEKISVAGVVKPAFALVSASSEGGTIDPETLLQVERALAGAKTVSVFAPPAAESANLLKASQLPAGWLAVDAEGRPLGAAVQIQAPTRSDASAKIASALGSQGVGSVTVLDRNRMVVALLAAGSGTPDVLDVRLDRPESIAAAVERLDRSTAMTRPSIGVLAIDVADVPGAVIAGVDATAASTGIKVGDIATSADGQPLADATALATLVAGRQAGQAVALELKDPAGATKRAELKVIMSPRLIGLMDQTVLSNRTVLDLRTRLATTTDAVQKNIIRLNLAVALARTGDWTNARAELKQVQLPDGTGVSLGTIRYLDALAEEAMGGRAAAETMLRALATSESLLTEDGPPIRELVEMRFAPPPPPPAAKPPK